MHDDQIEVNGLFLARYVHLTEENEPIAFGPVINAIPAQPAPYLLERGPHVVVVLSRIAEATKLRVEMFAVEETGDSGALINGWDAPLHKTDDLRSLYVFAIHLTNFQIPRHGEYRIVLRVAGPEGRELGRTRLYILPKGYRPST